MRHGASKAILHQSNKQNMGIAKCLIWRLCKCRALLLGADDDVSWCKCWTSPGVSVGLSYLMMCHDVSVGDLAFSRCKCGILCGVGVSGRSSVAVV